MLNPMAEKLQNAFGNLTYIFAWVALTILATLTAFQIHATLIAIAVLVVNNPALRPYSWTQNTIYSLSSFLWLVLGIIWLVWVMYTQEYLREGLQLQMLKKRIFKLLVVLGITYAICYLALLLI